MRGCWLNADVGRARGEGRGREDREGELPAVAAADGDRGDAGGDAREREQRDLRVRRESREAGRRLRVSFIGCECTAETEAHVLDECQLEHGDLPRKDCATSSGPPLLAISTIAHRRRVGAADTTVKKRDSGH